MKVISLKIPSIFSYEECLKFLGRNKNECLFSIEEGRVRRLFLFQETPVLVEFKLKKSTQLELRFLNIIPNEAQILAVSKYVEKWLNLKYDLNFFYKMAEKNNLLSSLVNKYYGLKLIGIPDFFEAICWAIIGQQINLIFAYTVKRNLVEKYGCRFQYKNKFYYSFPGLETILSISKQEFSSLKFSKQKTNYIQAIARDIFDQKIDEQELEKLDYETAKSKLLTIRGVGNWTADYILMKTFRHPQAFPIQDAGFQNALKKQLNLPTKPNLETILKHAKAWKGFEAYATFYLWRSLYD